MYNHEETLHLVNAQSKTEETLENPVSTNPMEMTQFLCRKETQKLVNAESTKVEVDSPPKKISESTYRYEEVYALQQNCYDPRNFGKVIPFEKKAKSVVNESLDSEEEFGMVA